MDRFNDPNWLAPFKPPASRSTQHLAESAKLDEVAQRPFQSPNPRAEQEMPIAAADSAARSTQDNSDPVRLLEVVNTTVSNPPDDFSDFSDNSLDERGALEEDQVPIIVEGESCCSGRSKGLEAQKRGIHEAPEASRVLSVGSRSSRGASSRARSPAVAARGPAACASPYQSPGASPRQLPAAPPRGVPSSARHLLSKLQHLKHVAPDERQLTFKTGTTEATHHASNKNTSESKSSVEILDQSFMSGVSNESEQDLTGSFRLKKLEPTPEARPRPLLR